jgi:hypothetical protein
MQLEFPFTFNEPTFAFWLSVGLLTAPPARFAVPGAENAGTVAPPTAQNVG